MIAYKFLRSGAQSLFARTRWPLPGEGPAAWLEAAPGPLVPCRNGLHACRVEDLAFWISDELWEVELGSEWLRAPDAVVARRARLARPIDRWRADEARAEFSHGCIARGEARCTGAGGLAAKYLEQAKGFAQAGNHSVAAYAAALGCGALSSSDSMSAFRAERCEQGLLLATVVGLG